MVVFNEMDGTTKSISAKMWKRYNYFSGWRNGFKRIIWFRHYKSYFGLGGIVIYLLIIVLAIVFIKKAVGLNYFFGYRTSFSLSSSKKWEWANNIYVKCVLIGEPIFLITHIVVFILSAVFPYFFLRTILTMALGLIYFIPIVLYIEIYGRIKFKNDKNKPLEPLIENERSKKQDIDDFWK